MIIYKNINRVLLSLISAVLLSACDSGDKSHTKRAHKPVHLVEVITAGPRSVSHEQLLSGTLEAATSARLHNEEAGRITQLPFHEGDVVKQGTLLIALDNEMIQAELDKAIATREQTEIDYKRLKKLLPRKLASDEEVARSLTTLNIAKADEQLQKLRMERTEIKAPFDGVISQRHNEPDDAVSARSHILSLIKPDELLVKVNVAEQWLSLINKGDDMQLSIDALGDEKHRAYIERIHPEISASTRKGTVELKLQPVPEQARPGQLARVNFKSQDMQRLVIPSHAIHHDIHGAYAYIAIHNIKDEKEETLAKKRLLKKGLRFGDWTEIISGIENEDQVIVKGFLGLRDDKKINIVDKNVKP